jgi:hypothetical protein
MIQADESPDDGWQARAGVEKAVLELLSPNTAT